jgi:hypothetical protein
MGTIQIEKQAKIAKVGGSSLVEVEKTTVKGTSADLFEFSERLSPLEKLWEIVNDNYLVSNSNHDL